MGPTRRSLVVAVVGLAVAAVSAVVIGAATSATPRKQARAAFPGGPYFLIVCGFSHRNNDDPIVFPGRRGASHNHTYVGNRSVDADSTLASLRGAATTCGDRRDRAGYWTPTLFDGSRPVNPLVSLAYYVKDTPQRVRPFPAGLKLVGGNQFATRPQSLDVTFWSCGALNGGRRSASVPTCGAGQFLNLHVFFPNCWDGRRLDSADHAAHTAYAVAGRCPATHPVSLPSLLLLLIYPDTPGTPQLSSGRFAAHGDFLNAWDQDGLAELVEGLN